MRRRHARADRARRRVRPARVCVVDEQHRFGVRQRAALDAKGPGGGGAARPPHDRDADPADALADRLRRPRRHRPARAARRGAGRSKTWVVGEEKRAGAYEFIRERLREGRQAYVVCPLVDELREAARRRPRPRRPSGCAAGEFARLRGRLLHGQMPAAREGRRRWSASPAGEADVLVATSVIEVGIDVANATVMLIEDAERYGLSQLHQLRGRVGRGEHESHCILFADPAPSSPGARLEAIAAERDGFKLAEVDLSLRGEGEVLGTRQHGLPRFRVAELPEDAALLAEARARGDRAARRGTARSTRPSSARCSTPRGGASATSAPSRSPPSVRVVAGRAARAGAWPRRRGAGASGRPPTGCARRSSRSSATSRGARVLDLFCGTGALGDRGALARRGGGDAGRHRHRRSPRRNVEELGLGERARVVRADALRFPAAAQRRRFDLSSATRRIDSPPALGRTRLAHPGHGSRRAARVIVESAARTPARARPAAARRAPLRRHPRSGSTTARRDEPTDASRSARAATTRSPTATSTSSAGRRASSTGSSSASSTSRCASRRRCSRAEERKAFLERARRPSLDNVEVEVFSNLARRVRPRARRDGDRQGPAGDLGLRVRVRDEPAQPQARAGHRVRLHLRLARTTASSPRPA